MIMSFLPLISYKRYMLRTKHRRDIIQDFMRYLVDVLLPANDIVTPTVENNARYVQFSFLPIINPISIDRKPSDDKRDRLSKKSYKLENRYDDLSKRPMARNSKISPMHSLRSYHDLQCYNSFFQYIKTNLEQE